MDKAVETALEITQKWHNHVDFFELETSGSTGKPKTIQLWRNLLAYSCKTTGDFLDIVKTDSIYCCLPLSKVGGFMQVIRAACWGIELEVVTPTLNPMKDYNGGASITSLTPTQFYEIAQDAESLLKLQSFRCVLIGGGMLNNELKEVAKKLSCRVFETYGMTETYSHIALLEIGKDTVFRTLGDIKLQIDDRGCIAICGSITSGSWLQTNDMGIIENNSLKITGRWDNIINTGGIKIQPEVVETAIFNQLHLPADSIIVAGFEDLKYGNKVVLIYRTDLLAQAPDIDNVIFTNAYEKPKICIPLSAFVFINGKIDRKATRNLITIPFE